MDEAAPHEYSRDTVISIIEERVGMPVDPASLDDRVYSKEEVTGLVRHAVNASKARPVDEVILLTERIDPIEPSQFITAPTEADLRVRAELARIAEAARIPPATDLDDALDWGAMSPREQTTERAQFVKRHGIRAWRQRLEAMVALRQEHGRAQLRASMDKARRR